MNRFYSTCAAGLEQIADGIASSTIRSYTLRRALAGALLYDAAEDLPRLPVFQNTYQVLAEYRSSESIERAAAHLLKMPQALSAARQSIQLRHYRSFRFMFSDQNKLVAINPGTRAALERAICGASVDRVSPETELLLLRRSEGIVLLLLRLTRRNGTEKTLARGELSPAIASAMAYLVSPRPDGIFLDPFSGHGAIGLARMRLGTVKEMHLFDIDPVMINAMMARRELRRPNVFIRRMDAMQLTDFLPSDSITELATDPPWGLFTPLPEPAPGFYRKMLAQFAGVLAQGGRLCVLTAEKSAFECAAAERKDLIFDSRIDILVNGKKAALYPATKKNAKS